MALTSEAASRWCIPRALLCCRNWALRPQSRFRMRRSLASSGKRERDLATIRESDSRPIRLDVVQPYPDVVSLPVRFRVVDELGPAVQDKPVIDDLDVIALHRN